MSDLWAEKRENNVRSAAPLAVRMRPRTLEEFIGQEHILGHGKMLRRMLQADRLTSVIFHGPPGTGKTTLAQLIARHTQRHFEQANAAAVGVKDIRRILDEAKRRLEVSNQRTILFLDEIHRFNKAQQDVLLGDVERGIVTLVGATTENPFFSVNSALVSRSQLFRFEPLSEQEIVQVVEQALHDPDRGFGQREIQLAPDAATHWARVSDGDARRALAALEIAVLSGGAGQHEGFDVGEAGNAEVPQPAESDLPLVIDLTTAEQSIQHKAVVYDGTGDEHYDIISAFIKSMRGSDPDAAIYWLARMLVAGEDPRFIARRIAILASEDIGNADPRAMQVASAAFDICERIGMPEAQLTLAQATIYMATAPKSNASALAIWSAMKDAKDGRTVAVPKHLRDGHYAGAKRLGHGEGYQYAYSSETGFVDQSYLGVDRQYYVPTERGYEQRISAFLKWIDEQRDVPRSNKDEPPTEKSPK